MPGSELSALCDVASLGSHPSPLDGVITTPMMSRELSDLLKVIQNGKRNDELNWKLAGSTTSRRGGSQVSLIQKPMF